MSLVIVEIAAMHERYYFSCVVSLLRILVRMIGDEKWMVDSDAFIPFLIIFLLNNLLTNSVL
jgi:hypothetical protein